MQIRSIQKQDRLADCCQDLAASRQRKQSAIFDQQTSVEKGVINLDLLFSHRQTYRSVDSIDLLSSRYVQHQLLQLSTAHDVTWDLSSSRDDRS